MKRRLLLLTCASLACSSSKVFNVHDDLLAFPQYEVIFSDDFIGDVEAESRLSSEASSSSAQAATATASAQDDIGSELSQRATQQHGSTEEQGVPQDWIDGYRKVLLKSTPYLCSIPQAKDATPTNKTAEDAHKKDEEKELARAMTRGGELLQDLEGHCMYFVSGWWSYSFCYNQEVRQFHALPPGRGSVPNYPPVEDDAVPAFILGQFRGTKPLKQVGGRESTANMANQASTRETYVQSKGEARYIVQNLGGGTLCDLTGKPRKVEVQFHCHPQSSDRIGWIKETATCSYLMVIYTPRLCNDVAFQPPKESLAQQITCKQVVKEASLADYQVRRNADIARKQLAENLKEPARPVVGGIVVGGMVQVGQDGKRIALPKPIERNEESGEVIAKWDPTKFDGKIQKLSDADLRKMDIDPSVVTKMREELHKSAAGKAWKLELVEVGRGVRELHGIVEGTEDATLDRQQEESYDESVEDRGLETDQHDGENEEGSQEVFKDEL